MAKIKGIPIVIDFDGTCVTHDYPRIGRDIGSVPVLKRLVANEHQLILFTMRSDKQLQDAVDWFRRNNIPLHGVQINPDQKRWTSSPKAYGQLIIDDASLGAPLKMDLKLSNRAFIEWNQVEDWLEQMRLI